MYKNQGGIMVQSGYLWEKQYNVIRRNNISYNKDVGVYVEFSIFNTFEENNIVKNKIDVWTVYFFELWYKPKEFFFDPLPCHNKWYANYWSNWKLLAPKPIGGILYISVGIFYREILSLTTPCFNFDFHPAMEPYKI